MTFCKSRHFVGLLLDIGDNKCPRSGSWSASRSHDLGFEGVEPARPLSKSAPVSMMHKSGLKYDFSHCRKSTGEFVHQVIRLEW